MRKVIKVQAGEMEVAFRGTRTRCAVVAAVMSCVPEARYIRVDRSSISWLDRDREERLVFKTPPEVAVFVEQWDLGNPVEPIEFRLTDSRLIARRPVAKRSTRQRIKGDSVTHIKDPGSRMRRS